MLVQISGARIPEIRNFWEEAERDESRTRAGDSQVACKRVDVTKVQVTHASAVWE